MLESPCGPHMVSGSWKPWCPCRMPEQMGTASLHDFRDREGGGAWGAWPHGHLHRPQGIGF